MIFYIMGKSASGKDYMYKHLLLSDLPLKKIVIYTTRPKRAGEVDGIEYHFVTKDYLDTNRDKVIEERVYHTVFGDWFYATLDDGSIKDDENYIAIGTLESYNMLKKYMGQNKIFPIYMEVDNVERLKRATDRENMQKVPKYDEMKRRFKADEIDFSEENIKNAGIKKRYLNDDFDKCFMEVVTDIKKEIENTND